MRLGLALALIAAIAAATPSMVTAQPASAGAAAFDDGRRLFATGDYAGALPRFREALESSGSPNAALYVARCLNETGDLAGAHAMMTRAVHDASQPGGEQKYAATRIAAKKELEALEKRVARVRVALADPPAGATVRVNGATVEIAALAEPIVVTPGKIRVEATAPGCVDASKEIDVAAGAVGSVDVALERRPAPAAPPPPPPAPSASGPTPLRTAGFVVAGAGAAGLVVFVVAGLMANGDYSTVEDACPGHCTDPKYDDVISRGRTLDTVANVGLAVAIAGLAGGGAMIVLGGPKADAPKQAFVGYRRSF